MAISAGLQSLKIIPKFSGSGKTIKRGQSKYLNNIVEQEYRCIKRIARPILDVAAFHSATAPPVEVETAHLIRKGELAETDIPTFKQFAAPAA